MRNFSYSLICSYVLIALGIYLLTAAGYDQFRGATNLPIGISDFGHNGMGHAYRHRFLVHRQQDPELFRRFMIGHWLWAVGIEGAGWLLLLKNIKVVSP